MKLSINNFDNITTKNQMKTAIDALRIHPMDVIRLADTERRKASKVYDILNERKDLPQELATRMAREANEIMESVNRIMKLVEVPIREKYYTVESFIREFRLE
jgi:hypothetical protein